MSSEEMKKVYPRLRKSDNYLVFAYENDQATVCVNIDKYQAKEIVQYLMNFING